MLPSTLSLTNVNNKNWTALKKLWKRLKIIRNQAKLTTDDQIKNELKDEEIEISKKIVRLSKTVTDGKGKPITTPFFPLLGSKQ